MPRNKIPKKDEKIRKKKILVISDGLTECNYIKGYIVYHPKLKELYDFVYKPQLSNTRSIYNTIKATYQTYEWIFALTDKDGDNHKKDIYNSFCVSDRTFDNLTPGFSNPSFEIWLYLHNNLQYSSIGRYELSKLFEKQLGKKFKSDPMLFNNFKDDIDTAIINSEKLISYWDNTKSTSFCNRNPICNVHNIIKKIKNLDS